ncbi:reverse transcriptase domain-containing protein [Tanacetum coccineum]|uniref:Reverse transcriptase domain-containing protein n=1 Tax=Tanacetum coccineum TaxID=301880 RepID=A0ABQ4WYH2_9ASTR
MITPVEKRDPKTNYCEFSLDTGHSTDECMQLRKQIDEMIKAGKLSQFIKELKQNDKPKAPKKGEASGKDKPLTILMIQPWERVAKPRITQSFSPETAMSFPPLREEDGTEGPMIIEVEMGGHFVHRVYIDDGASSEVLRHGYASECRVIPIDLRSSIQSPHLASERGPRTAIKGQILADFIVERPEEESPDELMTEPEVLPEPWTLFTDGSSCVDGSGAGLILTNPEGAEFTYAMSSIKQIPRSENKKADALSKIASTSFAHLNKQVLVEELKEKSINEKEILDVVEEEGNTWMTPICEYLAKEILPEDKKKARAVRRKAASMHSGPRSVVAKVVRTGYYWPTMHMDARNLIRECNDCQIHRPIPRNPQQNLTPITSLWLFYKWGIDIAGLSGKVQDLATREISTDNGKQFVIHPFKDWCEKLCIRQCFASVKHPQANGLVERANRSLGEGIKARLDERSKDWIEELPHVLGPPHNDQVK